MAIRLQQDTGQVQGLDDNGVVLWSLKPFGFAASALLPVDGSDDGIVLCNPDEMQQGNFRNLIRISVGGGVVWRAELPAGQANDAYVDVHWEDRLLVAHTWSANRVVIDVDTGRISATTFTK